MRQTTLRDRFSRDALFRAGAPATHLRAVRGCVSQVAHGIPVGDEYWEAALDSAFARSVLIPKCPE